MSDLYKDRLLSEFVEKRCGCTCLRVSNIFKNFLLTTLLMYVQLLM